MTAEQRSLHRATATAAFPEPGVDPAPQATSALATPLGRRLLESARANPGTGAVGAVLADYWRFVATAPVQTRAELLQALRDAIADGRTTARACLAIALGEPDFDLARTATRTYVGTRPASLERRGQAIVDVVDWIARALALNRAALFCALLDAGDELALEHLRPLRGRLSDSERATVLSACAPHAGDAVSGWLEEWCAD